MNKTVCCGDVLGSVENYKYGLGTYVKGKDIIASVFGKIKISKDKTNDGLKPTINVIHWKEPQIIPKLMDIVICKILKINTRFAQAEIISIGSKALLQTFIAVIRTQDVRQLEIDSIEMWKCFRVGDIIRAQIVCSFYFCRHFFFTQFRNYFKQNKHTHTHTHTKH